MEPLENNKKVYVFITIWFAICVILAGFLFASCNKQYQPTYVEKDVDYFYRLAAYNPDSVVDYSEIVHITTTEDVLATEDEGDGEGEGGDDDDDEHDLLKLKLQYFKVGKQNDNIVIVWKHTDEADVMTYVLEKAKDTSNFIPVYKQLPTRILEYEYKVVDKFKINQ